MFHFIHNIQCLNNSTQCKTCSLCKKLVFFVSYNFYFHTDIFKIIQLTDVNWELLECYLCLKVDMVIALNQT